MRHAAVHTSEGLTQAEQQALQQYAEALRPWEVVEVTHTHEGYLVVVTTAASDEEKESCCGRWQRWVRSSCSIPACIFS